MTGKMEIDDQRGASQPTLILRGPKKGGQAKMNPRPDSLESRFEFATAEGLMTDSSEGRYDNDRARRSGRGIDPLLSSPESGRRS